MGCGNITAVLAITMGEVTSPIQNVWFWLKHLRYRYQVADQMFAYVSWMYSAFYILTRSGFGLCMVRHLHSCTCLHRRTHGKCQRWPGIHYAGAQSCVVQ